MSAGTEALISTVAAAVAAVFAAAAVVVAVVALIVARRTLTLPVSNRGWPAIR